MRDGTERSFSSQDQIAAWDGNKRSAPPSGPQGIRTVGSLWRWVDRRPLKGRASQPRISALDPLTTSAKQRHAKTIRRQHFSEMRRQRRESFGHTGRREGHIVFCVPNLSHFEESRVVPLHLHASVAPRRVALLPENELRRDLAGWWHASAVTILRPTPLNLQIWTALRESDAGKVPEFCKGSRPQAWLGLTCPAS